VLNIEHIRKLCTGPINIDEPLAPLTSFRIGGPADLYLEPADADELQSLVRHFHDVGLPMLLIGNGSNILVSDEGFRGAAVSIERGFSSYSFAADALTAGAGMRLSKFVDVCISNGYAGAEMLAGIPGTLGGAIIMNAGAYGGEISDYLIDVSVLRDFEKLRLPRDECGFAYRNSDLKNDIVLSASFRFPEGDTEKLRVRRKELLLKRNAAQPVQLPNAGSIFKNPPGDFAARLIESCGLKGRRVGGAVVADLHANFIVNDGKASAGEVLELIGQVRRTVLQQTGVALELEIQLIGFSTDAVAAVQGGG
jgi:UDP-N-acetylmuramate dehydrogenase